MSHLWQCRVYPTTYPGDKKLHQQINLLLSRLDKQQRRCAQRVVWKPIRVERDGHLLSRITGVDEKTIQNGTKSQHEVFHR
jgi:hypothetical protein